MFAAMVLHKHNKHSNGNHSNQHQHHQHHHHHHNARNNNTSSSTSNNLNNNHINNNLGNVNQAFNARTRSAYKFLPELRRNPLLKKDDRFNVERAEHVWRGFGVRKNQRYSINCIVQGGS
ncbi:hypothetical protein KPH14_007122 [Odynerus spinipes]|uniref:Uncharacterized protein n=1 Tax=Odynerus spinipes TaxID=1348599 RepID=A0AAD9VS58_9HYME|nr:hypothetical protein KPH14_007122 [Odynerus spinipes]